MIGPPITDPFVLSGEVRHGRRKAASAPSCSDGACARVLFVSVLLSWPMSTDSGTFHIAICNCQIPTMRRRARLDVRPLEPGTPIERELAGGQSHSYQLTLTADQYLLVVVEQRGIDVVVQLLGPDDKQIMEFDSEIRDYGQRTCLAGG